jgi:A/G-specific adenine glycosylase
VLSRRFPATETELRALPGIGPYTAAAIAAIAYQRKATPVDGNVHRVLARLYAVEHKPPAAKAELCRLAERLTPEERAGDFAQAMMDLGATLCTPKHPACGRCPWKGACAAFKRGDPEFFPRRMAKRTGKLRRGAAFFALRADGAVLVRRRPPHGLLGGMTELPTTEWSAKFDPRRVLDEVPCRAKWRRLPGVVRHVFTHFPLELAVYAAQIPKRTRAPKGMRFVKLAALDGEALPSLMRKVARHATQNL